MNRRSFIPLGLPALAGVILLALWMFAAPNARADTTITVQSTVDGTLANLNGNGTCDLREAIEAANTNSSAGECVAGSGTDTIVFDAALTGSDDAYIVLLDRDTGEDNGEYGPTAFFVSSPIIIQGPTGEHGITLWGSFANNEQRIFHVTPGGDLTLQNMTLTQGVARGGDGGGGNAGGGGAAGMGGAIFNEGALSIERSTFAANTAAGGHGHPNTSDYGSGGGGGMAADGQDEQNDPGGDGGAPNAGSGGSAGGAGTDGGNGGGGGGGGGRWCACTHTGGAGGNGGFGGGGGGGGHALATGGGTAGTGGDGGDGGFGGGAGGAGSAESYGAAPTAGSPGAGGFGGGDGATAGTMSAGVGGAGGGGAGMGGAIFNHGGTVTVESSTFSGNVAWGGSSFNSDYSTFDDGGGGDGYGGAIFNRNGTVNVSNSTIVSNTVVAGEGGASGAMAGAGVYNLGDGAPAALVLDNTIVANSVGADSDVQYGDYNYEVVMTGATTTTDVVGNAINSGGINDTSGANNQIESHAGFAGAVVSGDDPQLGLLQDNTGPTETHAPLPGSVVIDAGDCGSEVTDQRGLTRPTAGSEGGTAICDIGAVEFDPNLDPVPASDGGEYLVGNMLRVSDMGADANTSYGANRPAVAYNATDDEYLVVWYGDDDSGSLVDNEFEIFGQRVDAATGAEIGSDFRISSMGPDGDGAYDAQYPRVAWNGTDNEYLVVWHSDDNSGSLVDNELEIFGQRVDGATGSLQGAQIRISDMGPDGNSSYRAQYPDVTWNGTDNEYLVVWHGEDDSGTLVDNENEIFGQRIDGATGAETGSNDFRISVTGPDGDTNYRAEYARTTWNATNNEYLVVWRADPRTGSLVDNEYEIFGQRLNGTTGAEVGDDDFRISSMGPDGDGSFTAAGFANPPNVVYNATDNEYLVTWWGDDDVDGNYEIYAQRLDAATGAEVGDDDFVVSDAGIEGNSDYNVSSGHSVAYDATNHEHLVVWYGDDFNPPLVTNNEWEVFAQRLDAATGAEVGANDARISMMGPDGDTSYGAFYPQVAANGSNEEYLIVWQGDDDTAPLVDGENEIFAQRFGVTIPAPSLTLNKAASESSPTSGDTLTYTVVVENSGSAEATSAVVSDTIPAGLSFVSGSTTLEPAAAGTTGDAPTLVSDLTIAAGESVTVTYEVSIGATDGPITNTASVSSAEITTPVTGSDTIDVQPAPSPTHTLSVTVDGDGSGSVSSSPAGIDCGADCSESYDEGTVVTLSASYNAADTELTWGGACAAQSGDSCQLTMDQAHSVTATFGDAPPTHTLNVTVDGDGSGSVSSSPAGIDCGADCSESYDEGTVVTLSASYNAADTELTWGGACAAQSGDSCQLTMDQAHSVTATFSDTTPVDTECVATGSGNWSEVFSGCQPGNKYVIPDGEHVIMDVFVQLEGDFEMQGTLDPNGMSMTLVGGEDQTLTGDPLTFSNLIINKDSRWDMVNIVGSLEVSDLLRVQRGRLRSASDYHYVLIDHEGTLELTNDITVSGNWSNYGTLIANTHTVTFDGDAAQELSGNQTLFYDLVIASGAELTLETTPGVTNTVTNNGLLMQSHTLSGATGTPDSFNFLRMGDDAYRGVDISTEADLGSITVMVWGNDPGCFANLTNLENYRDRCFRIDTSNPGQADMTFYSTAAEDDVNEDVLYHLGNYWMSVPALCGDADGASCEASGVELLSGVNHFLIGGEGHYELFFPFVMTPAE